MRHTMFFTKDRQFYKTFIVLALTLMLEQVVILSVNLADNLMLGSYSEYSLSGVAAVNQIQFILQQIVYGVSNGMIVLGSQYWGQKRVSEVKKLSAIGVFVVLVLTFTLFIVVSIFPEGTVKLFTSEAMIVSEGMAYLDIMRFSYVFFGISTIMLGTMRIAESVKIALRVSVVSLVINVCINYLLIFGNFGFPEMGVRGAAIGTLTARIVECIIIAVFLFKKEQRLSMKLSDYLVLDRPMFRDYIKVSTSIIVTSALWGIANSLQTVILGHMDKSAIAAQSISNTLYLLLKVTSVGAASAASIIIGRTVGADDLGKLKEYVKTLQVIFIGIGLSLAVLFTIIRFPLLSVYNISEETRKMANAFMTIQTITIFTMSYQMPTNTGIIRGGGDSNFILKLDIISIFIIVLPLSALSAFVWHLSPVIVTFILNSDQIFKCVPAFIHANSYKWVKKLTRDT